MPIRAQSADGKIHEFPDGTDRAVIDRVMKSYATQAMGQQRKRSLAQDVQGAVTTFNRNFVPFSDELSDGLNAAYMRATGEAKTLKEGWQKARQISGNAEASFAKDRPLAAAFTRGAGTASTIALPSAPGVNALVQGSRGMNMARAGVVAATEGAAYGLGDRGTVQERLGAANRNALLGGVLGAAGGAMAPATRRAPKRVDPNVRKLAEEGVQMTPGQMRGGMAKTLEDQATSLPILGPAIQEARTEGLKSFGRSRVNAALRPIGETLPQEIATGNDAIRYAGDVLSRGYENAVPGVTIKADRQFSQEAQAALQNASSMTGPHFDRLAQILQDRVNSRLSPNGGLDGAMYKQVQSELDWEVSRFMGSGDPDQRAIGEALQGVQSALESAARRQDPKFAKLIDNLDRGWSELGRIETAAAKPGANEGIFTAGMYDASVRAGDNRVRKRGYARGEAFGQDVSTAAKSVLPSSVPNSGTADRAGIGMLASVPGAVMGTMAGGPAGGVIGSGATIAGLTAARSMYSPRAIEAANRALNARIGREGQIAALRELEALAAQSPQAAKLYRDVLAKVGRTSAATASQPNALLGAGPSQ